MPAAVQARTSAGKPATQVKPKPAPPQPANVSTSPPVRAAVLKGAPAVRLEDTKVGRTPPHSAAGSTAAASAAAAPAPPPVGAAVLAGESDLSAGELQIPGEAAAAVQEGKDLSVPVRLPGLAEGTLKLRKTKAAFDTAAPQSILLRHPVLRVFSAANPTVLVLTVKQNKVTGFVSLGTPGPARGMNQTIAAAIAKGPALLRLPGLSSLKLPPLRNRFEGGAIDVGADSLSFQLGGFLSGTGSFALDNKAFSFEGAAKVDIPGGSGGELAVKKSGEGELSGSLDLGVSLGKVQGTLKATLVKGVVSVMGTAAYADDRLNGSITIAAIDEATARDITLVKPGAGVPNIELPSPDNPGKPGKRAFCGFGTLAFRINDWLTGNASVVVNSKGQATIVGEIAPPKEFELFAKKEWKKRLFRVEIKAGYGIPVVGEVGIFAGIQLDAKAEIGPGKLYNIKLSGAYSTDKRQPKSLTLEGTINISAFAGLVLRADAGVFVTILGHDIKAGVGLNALAGVRGYVEATPKIGMREPKPGQREYFIAGHMEIAAQPVLGFSGDLFVSIETPWWSPLSDKTWTWPLFAIEYPLPGEFGIGADVDYVLGSKKWPSIEFGSVDFDSSKFLSDVMNDNADNGHGGETKKPGDWQEGLGASGPGGAKNKGGKGPGGKADVAGVEPIGEEESFSDGGETHRLWFEASETAPSLMMASADPGKLRKKLAGWQPLLPLLLEEDRKRAESGIQRIAGKLDKLEEDAERLAAMNTATRKAQEVYNRNKGKKGPKAKKGKSGARELSRKIQAAERTLREDLAKVAALMRLIPFQDIVLSPAMHEGKEELSIVPGKGHPSLRVAGGKGAAKFDAMLRGPLATHAFSSSGLNHAAQAGDATSAQEKKIESIKLKDGKIIANNRKWLEDKAHAAEKIVSRFGRDLRIAKLQRALQFLPVSIGDLDTIHFAATPAQVGQGLYRRQFLKNLREQLRQQERGLQRLSADEWLANRSKFSMDEKAFRSFDTIGRSDVVALLHERAEKAKARADKTLAQLKKWIADVEAKKKKSADDVDRLQEWHDRLLRAEQRQGNAEEAILELKDVAIELIRVPERAILKARYDNSTEEMRQAILGRQNQEKKVRDKHKKNLDEFLKHQTDWSELAKTGSDLAILHRPDQVAGGYDAFEDLPVPPGDVDYKDPKWKVYFAGLRKMFGPAKINSLIGKQWKGEIERRAVPLRRKIGAPPAYPIHRIAFLLVADTKGL